MAYKVTLIPGDGVGPEIAEVTVKCIEATGVPIEWEIQDAGEEAIRKHGTPLPDQVVDSIRRNRVALKAPITTPVGHGFRSVNVALRKTLDLYACVRPCKYYPGVPAHYDNVDIVLIRENTEDLYAGIEFKQHEPETLELIDFIEKRTKQKIRTDSGISIKPISILGTTRIVKYAFDYARENKRKRVTAVHKANIMKHSDGLFLDVARQVAKGYSDIAFEDRIVDNMTMQLAMRPEEYDVLVLPNLYGDIVSDLCAGLVGGLGVAPGANIGTNEALFEATHGSAPRYKGLNKVNPTALILSGMLMLRYLGERDAGDRLERAVADVIREGKDVTYDLKKSRNDESSVGTREMGEAIVRRLKSAASRVRT
jgi:isocitrate dehydrogenase (NAD+)